MVTIDDVRTFDYHDVGGETDELPVVGPFIGVESAEVVTHGKVDYLVVLYRALNTEGIDQKRSNGVGILDLTYNQLVLDAEWRMKKGGGMRYPATLYGCSNSQYRRWLEIIQMPSQDFHRFIFTHHNSRIR